MSWDLFSKLFSRFHLDIHLRLAETFSSFCLVMYLLVWCAHPIATWLSSFTAHQNKSISTNTQCFRTSEVSDTSPCLQSSQSRIQWQQQASRWLQSTFLTSRNLWDRRAEVHIEAPWLYQSKDWHHQQFLMYWRITESVALTDREKGDYEAGNTSSEVRDGHEGASTNSVH